jgi:hypothetical protein
MIVLERTHMTDSNQDNEEERHRQLSLRQASKIANLPREFLEECIATGRLPVHLHVKDGATKFRVTRAGLEAADILPASTAPPSSEALVQLAREQAERLAAAEEQRFQLAGQLGAALERNRALERQLRALSASIAEQREIEHEPSPQITADDPSCEPGAESVPDPAPSVVRSDGAKPAHGWMKRGVQSGFSAARSIAIAAATSRRRAGSGGD